MNKIYRNIFGLMVLLFFIFIFFPPRAQAAEGVALSITPPLIKNNINPGEIWRSAIKVINNSAAPIDVYLSKIDFKNGKESGTVEFIKKPQNQSDVKDYLLSEWIVIDQGPVKIPAFGSAEVPFIIDVPEAAGPGGHYAAILAGTKPPAGEFAGTNIKVSSLLASLILLNVNGDVKEIGRIREFSTNKSIFYEPKVNFKLRFENLGNVHIQPQGEIKIYNFFNKEEKTIPLNHNTEFGNVLPGEIRKWNFSWSGGESLLDMGRYRAELIINYGESAKQTVDQKIFFWIIFPKPLVISLSVIIFLILFFVFIIRRYIKKSIMRTQAQYGIAPTDRRVQSPDIAKAKKQNSKINKNALNLKTKTSDTASTRETKRGWGFFKKLMMALFILVLLILIAVIYFNYHKTSPGQVENNQNNIEDTGAEPAGGKADKKENTVNTSSSSAAVDNSLLKETDKATGTSATTSENEILKEGGDKESAGEQNNKDLIIKVLNGSGRPGAANDAADLLKEDGYRVEDTANADNFNYSNTLIKYKKGKSQAAGLIAGLFGEVPDVQEVKDQEEDIIIIVGKNFGG